MGAGVGALGACWRQRGSSQPLAVLTPHAVVPLLWSRPTGQDVASPVRGTSEHAAGGGGANGFGELSPGSAAAAHGGRGGGGRIRFTDKDEHMYFWFPLLAGLSELTFDPRPEIRCVLAGTEADFACCLLPGSCHAVRGSPCHVSVTVHTHAWVVILQVQLAGGTV